MYLCIWLLKWLERNMWLISNWLYDKWDDSKFAIINFLHLDNNNTPTLLHMELHFTTHTLRLNLQFVFWLFTRHHILKSHLLSQWLLKNRLIFFFFWKNYFRKISTTPFWEVSCQLCAYDERWYLQLDLIQSWLLFHCYVLWWRCVLYNI
jgi:hypothetical protein